LPGRGSKARSGAPDSAAARILSDGGAPGAPGKGRSMRVPVAAARWLALATAWVAGSVAAALPSYVAVPLGTLGGGASSPSSINESGQVAGSSYLPNRDPTIPAYIPGNSLWRAFVHTNGVMRDLGMPEGTLSSATGINAKGQMSAFVVGTGAFMISDGVAVRIGPQDAADNTRALGINDAGQVTGYFASAQGVAVHAFVYAGGVFTDIHSLGNHTSGAAINARGDVTGMASFGPNVNAVDHQHAFLYSNGTMVVLGEYGVGMSYGSAINDRGDVAGDLWLPGREGIQAFLYAEGAMRDLGTLGGEDSAAFGINNLGQVVGASTIADGSYRAFLHDGTKMVDINTLVVSGLDGAVLTQAFDINDKGQIVVTASLGIGIAQAFRLDPLPANGGTKVSVVEFHHSAFDHYFLSGDPAEVDALDRGVIAGWTRTGQSFDMYSDPVEGAAPLCRFFSTSFGPKSSHFFTPAASECMWVNGNRDWQFEGVHLYVKRPSSSAECPAGTKPLFRVYNDGQGGAPAHRFTTSPAIRAEMLAKGWITEGAGTEGVGMCVSN
jgi:probable HAF family extracellular repeat protein